MIVFQDWQLTAQRVAIHRPTATAVVADIHLGYQEARRQSGDAIPLVDLETQLAPLLWVFQNSAIQNLLLAGDLFEKGFDRTIWRNLQALLVPTGIHFLGLVPGNHDRGFEHAPIDLPVLQEGYALGSWRVVHGDRPLPDAPAVLGHWHPCIHYRGRKIPCYVAGPRHLILPAYSQEAAGAPCDNHWPGSRCLGIVSGKVIEIKKGARSKESLHFS